MAHETCAACRSSVAPIRPSLGSKLACYGGLGALLSLVLAYPFGGFLWTFTIPVLMAAGFGIGPLIDAAFAPPLCPECHRRFEPLAEPLPKRAAPTILRA
jgi:hypothetical protein